MQNTQNKTNVNLEKLKSKLNSQMQGISSDGKYFSFKPFTCEELLTLFSIARKLKLTKAEVLPLEYKNFKLKDLVPLCNVHLFSAKSVEKIYSFLDKQLPNPNKKYNYTFLGHSLFRLNN